MRESPENPSLDRDSPFEVPALDSQKMRSSVAAKLFGGEAEPVRIGPYTVLRRLGAGGMGVVYAAYDERLDRKIAVKVMHGRAVQQLQEKRLRREAKALAQLSHPNVVSVFEVGSFRGQVFLAMEFLPGETLAHLERDEQLPLKLQLDPWLQAAHGLGAAHHQGMVHRDFKPANVMRLPDGSVKVFDFGLAIRDEATSQGSSDSADSRNLDDLGTWTKSSVTGQGAADNPSSRTKTMTGAWAGTPAYMAPEQHKGLRADARSDQFSFCVALWEYWTGQHPFEGSSRAEILDSIKQGKISSTLGSGMPGWLKSALLRGLSLDPQARFSSMQALVACINKGLNRRSKLKWACVAALPLLLGAGVSTWGLFRPDPCTPLSQHWDSIDPVSALAPASKRIEAKGSPLARSTFAQVQRNLQGYVKRGKANHLAACQLAMDDSQIGMSGFAAQSSCYLAASDAVRAFAKRILVASDKELRPELWLSSRLPSLSACAGIAAAPASKKNSELRKEAETSLAQAQVDNAFFDYSNARALAQEAIARSQELKEPQIESRAWLVNAKALAGKGEYEGAREAVDRSYRLAEQISDAGLRLDSAVLRASIMIRQGQVDEGASQLRDVNPLAHRQDIDAERRLKYFAAGCNIRRGNYQLCESLRSCVQGLELMKEDFGSAPTRNRMSRRLAWLYAEAGLIEKGLVVSDAARRELRRAVGDDSLLMMDSDLLHLTLQGEQMRLQGKDPEQVSKLLPLARDVHARYVKVHASASRRVIGPRTNLAELLRWAGRFKEARPLFESLLRDHPNAPDRYYTLVAYGQLLIAQGQKEEGIARLKEGLKIIEETRAKSEASGLETRIPEFAEAWFAIAKAWGATPDGIKAAKRAQEAYLKLHEVTERSRKGHDCEDLAGGADSYGRELQAVRTWLEEKT